MTRAMRELYLTHARMREFRGQTLYAIPSEFLAELPEDGVEHIVESRHAGRTMSHDMFRGGTPAANAAWNDTGVPTRGPVVSPGMTGGSVGGDFAAGQVVQHESYGLGQILDVSGYGALRRVKIRFITFGEKTFVADKVKLKVVPKKPS